MTTPIIIPHRKSSLASPKVSSEPLTPAALRQAWMLNKSRSETSLFPNGSRRRILPIEESPTSNLLPPSTPTKIEENNKNTTFSRSNRNILGNEHTKESNRKSSLQSAGNENPTTYASKASISPMIMAILDPVSNTGSTPSPSIDYNNNSNTTTGLQRNTNNNLIPTAIVIPQPQRSNSRANSRASSVTSSTMSPSLNMLRWFQGTPVVPTPRPNTPANEIDTTNSNSAPASLSAFTGTSSSSRPSSKRSSKIGGGGGNSSSSRSGSMVSFSTGILAALSSPSSAAKENEIARHRWKEGIITVMAANRFIQAAESRRERMASEEETKEKLRQQRIIKERAVIRKNLEDKYGHLPSSHPHHQQQNHSSRQNMRQKIDHLFHSSTTSPNQITSYLWVGSVDDANDIERLQELGISHILNSAKQIEPPKDAEELFIYKKISMVDTPEENLLAFLPEAFEFIKEAKESGGCILVHCVAGISRSVAITAAWLMEYEKAHLKNVMEFIRQRRPIALPNTGFRLALAHREIDLTGGTSVAKLRHDPMWNFNDWRNEENQYTIRKEEDNDGGGYGTLLQTGTPSPPSSSCCIIM
jgi:protein-tyrosine phosphatase